MATPERPPAQEPDEEERAIILVCEDEGDLLDDLAAVLTEAGYEVLAETSAEAALIRLDSVRADLILSDITLPGIDGMTFLRRVRQTRPDLNDVPFILLTGFADRSDILAGKRAGADDYLVKPFAFPELLARTRALTRRLREVGAMRAGIFSGDQADRPRAELLAEVRDSAGMLGRRLAEEVSITEEQIVEPSEWGWEGEPRGTVVAVDLGIKSMTPRRFAERGLRTVIVPADTGFQRIRELGADGVFFSNGPGDPETADEQVQLLREVLRAKIPFFGICFGNQLLGRALGFGTYKLPFGHRGINQPVLDRATGTVEITAQNHGFAVDAPLDGPVTAPQEEFGRVEVSHVCLNDDVVEGLRCLDLPAFSVQYHPEAAAGPHDAAYLFDRFTDLLATAGTKEARA